MVTTVRSITLLPMLRKSWYLPIAPWFIVCGVVVTMFSHAGLCWKNKQNLNKLIKSICSRIVTYY